MPLPLGVPYNGMTCTIVTMMLDGLSNRYKLKVKSNPESPSEKGRFALFY
jgi:hypothetical protein